MRQISFGEAIEVLVALRDDSRARVDSEAHRFLAHCLKHAAASQAQFLQDLWVSFELPNRRSGFFVEFGAARGERWSNTCYLERELGWRATLGIEEMCADAWRWQSANPNGFE